MQDVTKEFIRTLAAANGIEISEERLDLVRRQHEGFLRTLAEINAVPLTRETEPAITYALVPPAVPPPDSGR